MVVQVYRSNELNNYLRMANWTAFDAAHILSDVDPHFIRWDGMSSFEVESERSLRKAMLASNVSPFTNIDCPIGFSTLIKVRSEHQGCFRRRENAVLDMLKIMFSAWHDGFKHIKKTPEEWVSWALDKQYPINWLEFAVTENFFPESFLEINRKKYKVIEPIINKIEAHANEPFETVVEIIAPVETINNEVAIAPPRVNVNPDIEDLFDPLPNEGIWKMFLLGKSEQENEIKWQSIFGKAKANKLFNARFEKEEGLKKYTYNPSKVGDWLVKKGLLTREKVDSVLAKNLPKDSKDYKHLITGKLE